MSTRQNIIDLAEQFIRSNGYNAFSYGDIAGVLNIRKAAIHYHFPSKTDLGIAVVEREIEKLVNSRAAWMGSPANQQLKKLVETFYAGSRKGWICLNGSLTPDYLTLQPSLQEKVKIMSRTVLEWMTDCLEKGQQDKTLKFEGSPADRALLVMSALLSSLLLSRVLGSDVFDRMLNRQLADVEAGFRIDQTLKLNL
jgi:TetR/AcrR family transcriptional repressor of nem operon